MTIGGLPVGCLCKPRVKNVRGLSELRFERSFVKELPVLRARIVDKTVKRCGKMALDRRGLDKPVRL